MRIEGDLLTVAIMALFAAFVVEAVKRGLKGKEDYFRFIPIPLAVLCVVVGAACVALGVPGFEEMTLAQGGSAGFVAAALAAFGYDFVKGVLLRPAGAE